MDVVILAAGQGTRMKSSLPKVLHKLAGKPMLEHVINTARQLNPTKIVVVCGNGSDKVKEYFSDQPITWVEQSEQLGTGHAVQQALPYLSDESDVIVLYGDVPLIQISTLEKMNGADLTLLTSHFEDSHGFGRIIRDTENNVLSIVEQKDASEEQKNIKEINSGIMATKVVLLKEWLPKLQNKNAQKEFYLTDIVAMAVSEAKTVASVLAPSGEVKGVNDRRELSQLERLLQLWTAEKLLRQGVSIIDPSRFDCRGDLNVDRDVTIDINVVFEGDVTIGRNTLIGPNCVIKNSVIGENVEIKANSVIEGAVIESSAVIGPFARLRPGTKISKGARVGNFVEIKNTVLGEGSKASHLSYLGDATIGTNVNIGAGTITCNYDGRNKHHTTIEDNAFIGSNTELVAPVTIGAGATIGAGSTISKDAPAAKLTLARTVQKTIDGWVRAK